MNATAAVEPADRARTLELAVLLSIARLGFSGTGETRTGAATAGEPQALLRALAELNDTTWLMYAMLVAVRALAADGVESFTDAGDKWDQAWQWAVQNIGGGNQQPTFPGSGSGVAIQAAPDNLDQLAEWISDRLLAHLPTMEFLLEHKVRIARGMAAPGLAREFESVMDRVAELHGALKHEQAARRRLEALAP